MKFQLGAKFYALLKKVSEHCEIRCTFRFLLKNDFHHLKQRHRVVGVTKFLDQIFKRQKLPIYVIFKLIWPFYRVLNICSWGLLIIILWKLLKLDLGKSRLLFFRMQTELYFFCISYSSLRAKTPLNTSLYVFQIFKTRFFVSFSHFGKKF